MRTRRGWLLSVLLVAVVMLISVGILVHVPGRGVLAPARAATGQTAPTVAAVDPGVVINTADASISVLGSDFAAVMSGTEILTRPAVLLNGDALPAVGWVSSTTLTSTIPAGYAVGIYDVTVRNPDGLTDTLGNALTVQYPTPDILAFDPVSGTYGQPLTLVITGTDFVSPTTVLLNYTTLDADYVSSTTLTATIPNSLSPGFYDLTVSNPGHGSVSDFITDAFTLYSPIPTVSEVEPPKTYNDMDTSVVITGGNFAPTPQVVLGSTPLESVTWISMTRLTAQVPWGMEPGTYPLTVTNPTPGAYAVQLSGAVTMTEGFNTWTTGGPYGGHVQEIVHHPLMSTTVYAVASDVGVFAGTDAGEGWEMILRADLVTRITLDAADPLVIYVGGDGHPLRTRDGGKTWAEITPQLDPWTQAWNLYRPLAHPTDGCVIYLGKRTPDEPEVDPGGVFRSDDCGDNWAKWGDESSGLTDTHVIDLAFHPDTSDVMVAGTQSGNVFRSDDAGRSWTWQAHVEPQIAKITFNPFGDHEAWIQTRPARGLSEPPYVYTSTNLINWMPVPAFDTGTSYGPVTDLAFPAPNTVWAASGYGMVSTDGGATWSETQGWAPVLDVDGVVSYGVDPDAPNVLYGGHSLGGVSISTDGGTTWQRTSQGLAGVIPYDLAVAPDDPETLYTYTTRGLLKSQNGGRSWQSLEKWIGGMTGKHMLAVDPFEANRLYLGQWRDDAFCLWISENGGETWREVTSTMPSTYSGYSTGIGVISPHPTRAGHIFAGVAFFPDPPNESPLDAGGIFVSEDYGEQWSFLDATEELSSVEEIHYDAVNPDHIYAGTAGSGLWKSTTGGSRWDPLLIPGIEKPIAVNDMATHPDRAGVILARLLSFANTANSSGVLYVSQDAGGSWTQLDEGTSDGGLWFAPSVPGMGPYLLYSGCGGSPCRSLDLGKSWNAIYGVPAPRVMASATDGDRIVVYSASPGGMAAVEQAALSGMSVMSDIPGRGNVMGSGVYRTTLRPLNQYVYLPLIVREFAAR